MSTTYTGQNVINRLALLLGGPEPKALTGASNSTATLIVAAAGTTFGKTSLSAFTGRYASCIFDNGGVHGVPENESKLITSFDGTVTLTTKAFSAAITTSDLVVITPLSLPDMYEALNDVLRNLPLDRYVSASLLTDGDMAASTVTSWADITGSPTQTKDATTTLTGTQSLHVIYTVVDTSVGQSFGVTPGESLRVWAPGYITAGSWCLQAYDVSNAKIIYTSGTVTGASTWQVPWFQFTAPGGCYSVSIRIINKTAATTVDIDHVGLISDRQAFPYPPSSVTDTALIRELSYVPLITSPNVADTYIWPGEWECWKNVEGLRDYAAVNTNRINVYPELPPGPLFWCFGATQTAITTMAGTLYATSDVFEGIVEGAAGGCFRKLYEASVDSSQKADYYARYRSHTQTSKQLLRSLDIGGPQVTLTAQRRVSAGSRW